MIEGGVNVYREAVVDLTLRGPAGREVRVPFIVDTGFDSGVTLPASMVSALELPRKGTGRAVLGDGSVSHYDICEAELLWDGSIRRVIVDIAETEPLLGMGLLAGHELLIEVVPGGRVRIDPLPTSESQSVT